VVCGGRPPHLERLRAAGFRTWRSAGTRSELRELLNEGPLADDAVSVRHTLLSPEVIARLHQQAPSIIAWTVNDRRRARHLRDLGVDGVTTDRAAVLRSLTDRN
jgi:glycerophosphoryl diester phosphodiesterase